MSRAKRLKVYIGQERTQVVAVPLVGFPLYGVVRVMVDARRNAAKSDRDLSNYRNSCTSELVVAAGLPAVIS